MTKPRCTKEEYDQFRIIHSHFNFFLDSHPTLSESKFLSRQNNHINKVRDFWSVLERLCNEFGILLEIRENPHLISPPQKTLDLEMFKRAIKTSTKYGLPRTGLIVCTTGGFYIQTDAGYNAWIMPQIKYIFDEIKHNFNKCFPKESKPKAPHQKPAETEQKIEPQEKGGQSKTNITDYKALNLAKVPISRLIEQGESHTLEFKEIPECNTQQNRKNNDVLFPPLKTISGFLNAEGGILLIGVDNSGKIVGIEPYLNTMEQGNNDTFEQQIRNCLRDRFEPYPIGKVKVSFEKFMEGTVCRIDVQAVKEPVNLDNEVYVRDGNTTQLLKGRRLTDWIQQRRLLTALPSGK